MSLFCEWPAHLYRSRWIFAPVSGAELSLTASDRWKVCLTALHQGCQIIATCLVPTHTICEFTSEVPQYIYPSIHWEYEITHQVQWKQQCLHQNNSSNTLSPASKVLMSAVGKQKNKQPSVWSSLHRENTGLNWMLKLLYRVFMPHCSTNITMFCKVSTGKELYSKSTLPQNTQTL